MVAEKLHDQLLALSVLGRHEAMWIYFDEPYLPLGNNRAEFIGESTRECGLTRARRSVEQGKPVQSCGRERKFATKPQAEQCRPEQSILHSRISNDGGPQIVRAGGRP